MQKKLCNHLQDAQVYIAHLEQRNAELESQVSHLTGLVEQLTARVQELEASQRQDSGNSSLPPSKGPKKTQSLRRPSGRRPGGQPAHSGHHLSMRTPDEQIIHQVEACQQCGSSLVDHPVEDHQRRQVWDVPPLRLHVCEHLAEQKRCACGHVRQACFPEQVWARIQYGAGLPALAVGLCSYQFLSYQRASELMEDLVGCRLSPATIQSAEQAIYQQLEVHQAALIEQLQHSAVVHADETGLRLAGRTVYVHVAGNQALTSYHLSAYRGRKAYAEAGVLPSYQGRLIHDSYSSYDALPARHGLCNAHLLRELLFFQQELPRADWAAPRNTASGSSRWTLINLLLHAKRLQEQRAGTGLPPGEIEHIERQYRRWVSEGLAGLPPDPVGVPRKARALLGRMQKKAQQVLGFVYDPLIPFDNNQAERDLRMVKLRQKVSGCQRTWAGAERFLRIRGYISSLRKQGLAVMEGLRLAIVGQPWVPQG